MNKLLSLTLRLLSVFPVCIVIAGGVEADNTASYLPDYEIYEWKVFIAAHEKMLALVDSVQYELHPSFENPVRMSYDQNDRFAINGTSWGEFSIYVTVYYKNGRKRSFEYWLNLERRSQEQQIDGLRQSLVHSSLSVENTAKYSEEYGWEWEIYVETADSVYQDIDRVIYVLHPSFNDPVRIVTDQSTKFKLSEKSWEEFTVEVLVKFKDGSENRLLHLLSLKQPRVK